MSKFQAIVTDVRNLSTHFGPTEYIDISQASDQKIGVIHAHEITVRTHGPYPLEEVRKRIVGQIVTIDTQPEGSGQFRSDPDLAGLGTPLDRIALAPDTSGPVLRYSALTPADAAEAIGNLRARVAELEALADAAEIAIGETIRRPLGVVPDSAADVLKQIRTARTTPAPDAP